MATGPWPPVSNTGLIVKKAGTGTSTIGNTLNFDNQGTVDVRVDTVALPSNFSNNGTLKGAGTFSVSGTRANAGTAAPGASPGTLALSCYAACSYAVGDVITVLDSVGNLSGSFAACRSAALPRARSAWCTTPQPTVCSCW